MLLETQAAGFKPGDGRLGKPEKSVASEVDLNVAGAQISQCTQMFIRISSGAGRQAGERERSFNGFLENIPAQILILDQGCQVIVHVGRID